MGRGGEKRNAAVRKKWTMIDILPQRRTMIGYGLMTMPWGSFPTRIYLTTLRFFRSITSTTLLTRVVT